MLEAMKIFDADMHKRGNRNTWNCAGIGGSFVLVRGILHMRGFFQPVGKNKIGWEKIIPAKGRFLKDLDAWQAGSRLASRLRPKSLRKSFITGPGQATGQAQDN